ncbi:MAG: 3-dehydroquinate synthase family protein [Clostridia bacterium]|nr:3-dehydroquinate synthase family protein [Clostridia bacterium]
MKTKIIISENTKENFDLIYSSFPKSKIVVVSDKTVNDLYEDFFPFPNLVLQSGEKNKEFSNIEIVLNFFIKNNLSKSDTVIAFGGGGIIDLVGLCATIYKRGINLINYPTTLLSMTDAAIGGKNAVNFSGIKNSVGAFLQPTFVFSDINFLKTLDQDDILSGIGEIIKYAVLGAENLYEYLENFEANKNKIIQSCSSFKLDITSQDPFDKGKRKLLNLGHTFGHAIESVEKLKLSHGSSVINGILMIGRFAVSQNLLSNEDFKAIQSLINKFDFPIKEYDFHKLWEYVLEDKKINSDMINLVIPTAKDHCIIKQYFIDDFYEALRCI